MLFSIGKNAEPENLVGLLEACHQRIRSFVQMAIEVGQRAALPEAEVIEACQRVRRYFTEALPLHIEDEEQSLLPRLSGLSKEVDEALALMKAQHSAHEDLLKELLSAAQAVEDAPGEQQGKERLLLVASELSTDFEAHLSLEEQLLFPAARQLAPNLQNQIMAELRQRRQSADSS